MLPTLRKIFFVEDYSTGQGDIRSMTGEGDKVLMLEILPLGHLLAPILLVYLHWATPLEENKILSQNQNK